jgi:hypothetical protein
MVSSGVTGVGIHPVLQDQDGGHLVDDFATALDGHIGLPQQAVGLGGGEALVPKMDGEVEVTAQVFGEGLHFFCAGAFGSAHAEGVSDDDFGDAELVDNFGKSLKIGAFIAAVEGFDALGGDAERVGDGESDAARADVESQNAAADGRYSGRRGWVGGHWRIIS